MANETIVTAALTGGHMNFHNHPNFPITPKQIAESAIEARKAEAVIVTAGEALEAELCAAKVRACRERIRTLGAQLDVGRTLSAAIRSQFQAEPVGQWT